MPIILITFLFFFTVSIAAFGMLLGSLMAGPFANLIGRQWASIIGTCGCLAIGYSLFAGAQYVWMMLLGRFMHGAGLGFSTTVSTLYIMEVRIISKFVLKFGVVDPLFKVEKNLKGSLDLTPSPSPSVISKSLLTTPSNVLPLDLKQTFP